ncbi:styrene monooxygenase/indole monooxygenase family protein [Streptomyces sp. NPDC002588]|uniref:styrene monooxygenase/indole monooxygenase family protein n=1 Tax=Streptomyces sp. NPDC002588 TaxID=3154419 RepID=UPI00332D50FE
MRSTARSATVIGAGQGGLHLALGLIKDGWRVRLVTNLTPEQYAGAQLMSGHMLQQRSVLMEQVAGAAPYSSLTAHPARGVDFALSADGRNVDLRFQGDFEGPALSLDTRLKCSTLLETFRRQGGEVHFGSVGEADLAELAEDGDPVFVATGRAGLSSLFDTDEARTVHDRPQRQLLLLLVSGFRPLGEDTEGRVKFCFSPEHGEIFFGPQVHLSNTPVHSVFIEARPGGAMDRFREVGSAAEALEIARALVSEFAAWELDALREARPSDPRGWLRGAVTPLVRRPVAALSTGRCVFGVGDVLMVCDPAAGQGGNATAWGVHDLLAGLRELDGAPVTRDWYEDRFERFWAKEGRYFAGFSNMLLEPPNAAAETLFAASARSRAVADRLASCFAHPKVLMEHLGSVAAAERFIREAEHGVRARLVGEPPETR